MDNSLSQKNEPRENGVEGRGEEEAAFGSHTRASSFSGLEGGACGLL